MGLLKSLYHKFKKKPSPPPKEVEDLSAIGGVLAIVYNVETGDIYVEVDILNNSELSAELLARLLCKIEKGEMQPHIYQSLALWAEDDAEKTLFSEAVFNRVIEIKSETNRKLAVEPWKVFNFREMEK